MDVFDHVERIMLQWAFAAALDVASSPSSCAILCIAAGENPSGMLTLAPKHSVDMSTCDTSMQMRGRRRMRLYAAMLSSRLGSAATLHPT